MKRIVALLLVCLTLVGLYGCGEDDISLKGKVLSGDEISEFLEKVEIDSFSSGLTAKANITGKTSLIQEDFEMKSNVNQSVLSMLYFGNKTSDYKAFVSAKSSGGANDMLGLITGITESDMFMYQTATRQYYNYNGEKQYEDVVLSDEEYQNNKNSYTNTLEQISSTLSGIGDVTEIKDFVTELSQYGVVVKLNDNGAKKTLGLAYSGNLANMINTGDLPIIDEAYLQVIEQLSKVDVKFRLLIELDEYSVSSIALDFYIKGKIDYVEGIEFNMDLKIQASLSNQVDLSLFPKASDLVDYQKAS